MNISVAQAAHLTGVSVVTVRTWIKNDTIKAILNNTNGGRGVYSVILDSLPKEAQERYWEQQRIAEQVAKAKRGGRPSKAKLEARAQAQEELQANATYQKAPDWQKSEVDRRVYIVESTKGLSQKEAMVWVDEYNLRNADRPCKCSLSTLNRWRKLYKEGGKNALMTGYGKRKGQSIIEDDVFSVFYSVYAKEGKVSTKTAWIIARGYYTEHYEGECPSLSTFEYRLKHDPNISEQEIYFNRHGASAYNRKYGYYIERDLSKLIAGQCAVGDHMQFDLMVRMPDGKVVRPWLTAWIDMKSRRFLGWCSHPEAPNSSHIFQSFYHMADRCGLPEVLYLDNGRDYRSKDFAGGRRRYSDEDKERITSCLTGDLGIEVTFALPRNAQAKVIERRFRDHHDKFERLFKGYTGTNIAYKPEALNEQVKKQEVLSWDRFLELLEQFLETLDRVPFGAKAHFSKLSPVEIWNADNPALRRVSKDSLALFCMRSSRPIKVGRAGVKDPDLKVTYWAPELEAIKGQPVYLRRDPANYSEAWVFSIKDELICLAELTEGIDPLCKTPESKAQLAERMARKRQEVKRLKAAAAAQVEIEPEELIRLQRVGIDDINKERGYTEPDADPNVIEIQNTPIDKRAKEMKRYLKEATTDSPALPVPSATNKPKRHLSVWGVDEN